MTAIDVLFVAFAALGLIVSVGWCAAAIWCWVGYLQGKR